MDESYGDLLRSAIERAGTSRRKFSFRLAELTGNQRDSEYRTLGKYLNGQEPEPDRAAILAVELGEPRLALVAGKAQRRSGRRAELEARVADLEALVNVLSPQVEELANRVVTLERRPTATQRRAGKGSTA